jgi:hypothetical protein
MLMLMILFCCKVCEAFEVLSDPVKRKVCLIIYSAVEIMGANIFR